LNKNRLTCPLENLFISGLLISRTNKLKLFALSKKFPTDLNIAKYKTFRNLFNRTVRAAKVKHYELLFEKINLNLSKPGHSLTGRLTKSLKKMNKI